MSELLMQLAEKLNISTRYNYFYGGKTVECTASDDLLKYMIKDMGYKADSNEDIMYWTNNVGEFMDTILNVSCETIEIYAHNLFFDIKPFITYFINNYPAKMLKNNIEETKIYD